MVLPCCFGPVIWATAYPKGFQIDKMIKPYDGTARPATRLQDYSEAVDIAEGNSNQAVKYLPLMLTGIARQWIDDFPEKSICNWLTCMKRSPRISRVCTNIHAMSVTYSGASRKS